MIHTNTCMPRIRMAFLFLPKLTPFAMLWRKKCAGQIVRCKLCTNVFLVHGGRLRFQAVFCVVSDDNCFFLNAVFLDWFLCRVFWFMLWFQLRIWRKFCFWYTYIILFIPDANSTNIIVCLSQSVKLDHVNEVLNPVSIRFHRPSVLMLTPVNTQRTPSILPDSRSFLLNR